MKQDVLFMGKELHVEGDNLSDILHYAFPQMVEAAIAVYNDLSFANNASKETTTFRQVAETWFNYYHVPNVSKATANNTRIHLDKHIYPIFGDKPLKDITRDDIQSFLVSNPNIGFTTIKSLKIVINAIFRKAMEDGLIDKNPASAKFPIPGKKGKRSSLSLENANDIIDHLSDLSFDDRFFIMVPLYAGLRRGEMLGLQWERCYKGNIIYILFRKENRCPVSIKANTACRIEICTQSYRLFFISAISNIVLRFHKRFCFPIFLVFRGTAHIS